MMKVGWIFLSLLLGSWISTSQAENCSSWLKLLFNEPKPQEMVVQKISRQNADQFVRDLIQKGHDQKKIIKCKEVLEAGWKGKNLLVERLAADYLILTTAFAASSPSPLFDDERHDFVFTQYLNTGVHSVFTTSVGKALTLSQLKGGYSLVARFAVATTSNRIQSFISSYTLHSHSQLGSAAERSFSIQNANDLWTPFAVFKGFWIDDIILNKSPAWAFNFCMKNKGVSAFFAGPNFIAVADRVGSWFLYLAWLRFYTGE